MLWKKKKVCDKKLGKYALNKEKSMLKGAYK